MVVIIVATIVHLQAGKQGIPQFSTLSQISARQGISLMLMGLLLMMMVMLLLITTILLMMLVILLMTNGLLTFYYFFNQTCTACIQTTTSCLA